MPERTLAELLDEAIESMLAGTTAAATGEGDLAALTEIAIALRYMPAEDFKARLKTELQRRTDMSASTAALTGVGKGFRTITPFLIHEKAPELVDFIKTTFEAEELKRDTGEGSYGFYAEVRIGDSVVMAAGGAAASWGNLPGALHVYVPDCDAAYRRAIEAGAVTLMGERGKPADQPYGERSALVEDPFGNYWYIATRLDGVPLHQGSGSVMPYLHPKDARTYIDFLKLAFGAEEIAVYEEAGRVTHAAMRVGDAVLEMGEPEDRAGIPLNGLFLLVEDVDSAYARALAAGATAVRPPDDQPYGLRSAIVRDPAGYLWWPARRIG